MPPQRKKRESLANDASDDENNNNNSNKKQKKEVEWIWEWAGDSKGGSQDVWVKYDKAVAKKIEKAYQDDGIPHFHFHLLSPLHPCPPFPH